MQQVWAFAKRTFGKDILPLFFIALSLGFTFLILRNASRSKSGIYKLFLNGALCILGFIFAWGQPYATEKIHILEYGLLGWLAMRDFSRQDRSGLETVLYTFIFVLVTSLLDEGFQKLLPWRVFEVRDILTNLVSGILGISVFIAQ